MSNQGSLVLSFIGGVFLTAGIFWFALTQSKVIDATTPGRPYAASKVISPESSPALIAKGSAPQYRDEIMKYVIDPCFAQISRKELTGLMSEKQAVDLLKITEKEAVEKVVAVISPVIKGATFKERQKIYEFGLSNCLSGTGF